jgi:hypothetical protein
MSWLFVCGCVQVKDAHQDVRSEQAEEPQDETSASEESKDDDGEESEPEPDLHRSKTGRVTTRVRRFLEAQRLDALKAMLRHNGQPVSGNKSELLARITRCIEYGCLPRCPTCEGGLMKEEKRKSKFVYRCPGYMEGTDFQNCGFTTEASGLHFPAWQFPEELNVSSEDEP